MRKILAADLFCGAGGTSSGLKAAARELGLEVELIAVNHWEVAIATHSKNHPEATHLCESLDNVDPKKLVPGGRLNLLCASPPCTHHSRARGGKPMLDQMRSSAWRILDWATDLYIDNILIENVKEFAEWGPLGVNGLPLKSKKGETFQAFLAGLRGVGYKVEYRVLNAADYGDPTTRERLFIMARRSRTIVWPMPSHAKRAKNQPGLFGDLKTWTAAREIIDWDIPGKSIFDRKKPLAAATMERIAAGLRKFGGNRAEPFLVILRNHMNAQSLDEPLPTVAANGQHHAICEPFVVELRNGKTASSLADPLSTVTTKGAHHGLIEPFVLGQQSCSAARSTDQPIPTVAGAGAIALVEPFIVPFFGEREGQTPRTHSVNDPLPAVTGQGAGALVQPFVVPMNRAKDQPRSTDEPLRTVTATSNDMALVEPFIITAGGPEGQGRNAKSINDPLHTVLADPHHALVEPFVIPTNHGSADKRSHDILDPMPTVTSVDAWAVIEPLLMSYYGHGDTVPVSQPVPTVTTKDRFALVQPDPVRYDIRFRMLQPHELARAQGFPDDYEFAGNREAKVKQIGNAVPVNLAKALCMELIATEKKAERAA
ncbi:MAG: cytosine-specific methylase [Bryobacterales bacterium]|nr:cytosine-specific methylase [Bryobacterales bacterium]